VFLFVYATEVAMGIVTPLPLLESRTTEKQRKYLVLLFSVILATVFLKGFASVMGVPAPTMGLLGIFDYRDVLKFGKTVFHFVSALLPYLEITLISSVFYALCYGLIALLGERAERG